MYNPTVQDLLNFFTKLYDSSAQYGTLNSCKSALSLILGQTLTSDDRIKRFYKGVFRLRPPLPKYHTTWDTSVVLNSLANWYPNENLSLEELSKKLATLLALTTAHRVQTISKINILNIKFLIDQVNIMIPDLLKTSRPGALQPVLNLPVFKEKPQICPVTTLRSYLLKTQSLRTCNNLFISTKKPHKPITSQTLSKWIKLTLGSCGIDTSIFTAHSTRHATTSKAHQLGVNLNLIRQTAGWSGSSQTFGKFYNRIIQDSNVNSFAKSILIDSSKND